MSEYHSANYELHQNQVARRGRIARAALKGAAVVAGAATLVGGVVGINEADKQMAKGTQFPDKAAAMAVLQENAAKHGDDLSLYNDAQDRMEKDLRGANPIIMKDLGQQVLAAASGHEGTHELSADKTLTVSTVEMSEDRSKVTRIELVDSEAHKDTSVMLTQNNDGSLKDISYASDAKAPSMFIGGPAFDYEFGGNEFTGTNSLQYADGRPSNDTPGAAIVVDNTSFSNMMSAGPATETVLHDIADVQMVINAASSVKQ